MAEVTNAQDIEYADSDFRFITVFSFWDEIKNPLTKVWPEGLMRVRNKESGDLKIYDGKECMIPI